MLPRTLALLCLCAAALHAADRVGNLVGKIDYHYLTADRDFYDYRAVFSPDGSKIVFEHHRIAAADKRVSLYTLSTNGKNLRPLFGPAFPYGSTRPSWSQRTGQIAFTSEGDGFRLWVANSDGSDPTEITSPMLTDNVEYPHWYPDGRAIVLVDYLKGAKSEAGQLKKVTLDPADPANPLVQYLTDPATLLAGEPAISPDGRHIATAAQLDTGRKYDQEKNSIWLVDDATHALRLFDKLEGRAPAWSPNGKWITFESNRGSKDGNEYAIFAKRYPDGGRLYQLTPYIFNAQHCAWSPDGRYILCSAQLDADSPTDGGRGILVFRTPKELRR